MKRMEDTGAFIISRSPEETYRIGEQIGSNLIGGELIALEGGLGAGKTLLVQGLAKGLGITDGPITSPTFVFIHEFHGRCPFAHVDLFRTEREEDILDLGVLEYLEGPWVVAIEWADKAGGLLPDERLTLRMSNPEPPGESDSNVRRIEVKSTHPRYQKIIDALSADMSRAAQTAPE